MAGLLRPRAGQQGRQGRRPALGPAGDRHADARPPHAPIEPEVDLSGHWIDGDHFHVGRITVGNDATIGARTTLLPGAVVGKNADVAPGSGVVGKVKNGQYWKGSPAVKSGKARHPWPDHRPPRAPLWVAMYGVTSVLLGGLPLLALGAGLAVIGWGVRDAASLTAAIVPAALWTPVGDAGRGGHLRAADGARGAGAVAVACARAITRCAAGSAGSCGPPNG